jgi:hypothetical protein
MRIIWIVSPSGVRSDAPARVRFTVRRMMVAVAVAAIGTAAVMTWQRSVAFRRLAEASAAQEFYARQRIDDWSRRARRYRITVTEAELVAIRREFETVPPWLTQKVAQLQRSVEEFRDTERGAEAQLGYYRRQAEYVRRLKLKYELASRYPWLPVAPDPPEPEQGRRR